MTRDTHPMRIWPLTAFVLMALAPGCARATTFTQVTSDTMRETDPAPSPDGKWIAFTSDRCGHGSTQVYLMPAEGGEARQLSHEPDSARAGTPTWAPDGKSLLFISTRGHRYNVYSIPFDGGEPRKLTHGPGSHRFASYSSDGKKIVFYSNRLRPTELYGFNIYIMGASGEEETAMARQVTNSMGSPGHPTLSPDGNWVAFVAKDYDPSKQQTMEGSILFTKYHVFKVRADGGPEIRLTKGAIGGQPVEDTWPSWSPDGKWIAFGRQVGTKRNVWIMDVATNKTFPLTTAGNCIKPTWAYDSKSLYYSSIDAKGNNEDIWVARDLTLKPPAPARKPATKKAARAAAASTSTKTTHR